jgi:hypothetical protein
MRAGQRQTAAVVAGLVAVGMSSTALAAHPKRSATYAGTGRLCENNTPHHGYTDCVGGDSFVFGVSANGSRVIHFAGHIGPLYCGGGTLTVTAAFIGVARNGAFAYSFGAPSRGPTGKINGHSAVQIRGRFTGNGRQAHLFYRLATHFKAGGPVCGAQVSGTARAR